MLAYFSAPAWPSLVLTSVLNRKSMNWTKDGLGSLDSLVFFFNSVPPEYRSFNMSAAYDIYMKSNLLPSSNLSLNQSYKVTGMPLNPPVCRNQPLEGMPDLDKSPLAL